jgi:hypothetical protein
MSEDAKFRLAARNGGVTVRDVLAVTLSIFEDAAADEHRGVATRGAAYHSLKLDLDEATFHKILNALADVNVVSETSAGIVITNWAKRQFESDHSDPTNAHRQQRYRDRRRAEKSGASITPDSVTRNRPRNGASVGTKRPETETETDIARGRASHDARKSWNGEGEKLIAKIGKDAFERKFAGVEFRAGPPATLIAPRLFQKNTIRDQYGQTLVDIYGNDVVVAFVGELAA